MFRGISAKHKAQDRAFSLIALAASMVAPHSAPANPATGVPIAGH